MEFRRKAKTVITIHGIRTSGKWQKDITTYLAKHGLVPYHIDYGWFAALGFFIPFLRERKIAAVRKEIQEFVSHLDAGTRVSIIAHSFGTHLAMKILERDNGAIEYDRIVLTGSIVPRNFDWHNILTAKRWALAARNERATEDSIVGLASFLSSRWCRWLTKLDAGDSGKHPFHQRHHCLFDDQQVGGHSQLHNPQKYEQWARFVAYPALPDDLLSKLRGELESLRKAAAETLQTKSEKVVRANLFAPIQGKLRIVPGATDNMLYVPEFDLAIDEGIGATGNAFKLGLPCFVKKVGRKWKALQLLEIEEKKIHPDLQWVLSFPVRSEPSKTVLGVVNIDGLNSIPQILDSLDGSESEAAAGQAAMLFFQNVIQTRIAPILEHAFNGTRLKDI